MNRFLPFILVLSCLALPTMAVAVTPMEHYQSFVAGGDQASFRDGSFTLARFNEPLGMAMDLDGNKLYIADSGNHRVRVVCLGRDNEVKTLAGSDKAGTADGPLPEATFDAPTALVLLPDHRLAVFDSGSQSVRLIDLRGQKVSTLARNIQAWNMVYRGKDNALYLSEPDLNKVVKLDMKSLVLTDVISNNPILPSPAALCLFQDRLCVADKKLPMIYGVNPDKISPSAHAKDSLTAMGKANDVLALSSSDGFLYALEKDGLLVKVGTPHSSSLRFPTPWGFLLQNTDHGGATRLFKMAEGVPAGFLASPVESRKFFISSENMILSVKDYDFEKLWSAFKDNDHQLTDFDYPFQKPAKTFRILTIGTSRNSTSVPISSDPKAPIDENLESPRVLTFSKRLELLLNTEASLRDLNLHFEILNLTQRGHAISSYGYYVVPEVVKKYDIDLVLALADQTGYKDYYEKPLTAEGVPAEKVDYEYLQKPLSERARSGVAADLIRRCKELKIPVSDKQDFPGDGYWSLFCNGDKRMQDDLREMTGRRLELLREKMNSMKNSGGHTPQLIFYYVPGGGLPNDCCAPFWEGVCGRYHLKFHDFSQSFNALRTSYGPAYVDHFTAYGNELVALLLKHYLIENKIIPF